MKLKIAEVRNFKDDPTRSGRCRVRIYNENNNEQQVKDDDLPWATPLHPVTSAATAKIGISPSGLLVGSRVLITYLPEDTAEQYPIILGSLGRGDLPNKGGVGKEADEDAGGSIKEPGPDNPGNSNKSASDKKEQDANLETALEEADRRIVNQIALRAKSASVSVTVGEGPNAVTVTKSFGL